MAEPNVPGLPLTVEQIREMKKQLVSTAVHPDAYIGYCAPVLRDGVVYAGIVAMHPSCFLDIFGVDLFRKIKRDISKRRIENYIKKWEKNAHS